MRTPALAAMLAAALLVPLAPATGPEESPLVHGVAFVVDDHLATGLIGLPDGPVHGIVAIVHGYGHFAESHRGHLQHLAERGYVAFAMDGGEGMPLRALATDTMAQLDVAKATFPNKPVHLYSVSMGTAAAAIVLAERDDIVGWVDNEGLAMLAETWAEASAVAPAIPFGAQAARDIEAECGGSPAIAPDCYLERSAAVRAALGEFSIEAAILTHGLNDGLVPYDQGRSMAAALRANGIPTEFYTVATCEPGSEGTTITGHATLGGQGVCGHGTESNDGHTLTKLSFDLLDAYLAGELVPSDGEHVVDGTLGTLP